MFPKNNSPLFGVAAGTVVVLIFVVVSLGINISKTQKNYEGELSGRIKAEELVSKLNSRVAALEEERDILLKEQDNYKNTIKNLTSELNTLKATYNELIKEMDKIKKLKEQLEKDLKEALYSSR